MHYLRWEDLTLIGQNEQAGPSTVNDEIIQDDTQQ